LQEEFCRLLEKSGFVAEVIDFYVNNERREGGGEEEEKGGG
jgi:hypothetical protein